MLIRTTLIFIVMFTVTGCATNKKISSDTAWHPTPAKASPETMNQFRALEGTWTASYPEIDLPDQQVLFETIAGDSVVVETIFQGTPHEMMTTFYIDDDQLRCTHYCAVGNQPHLVAEKITPKTVEFATMDVVNMASPDAMYMGAVQYEFIDNDHCRVTWTSFENGQAGDVMVVNLNRN